MNETMSPDKLDVDERLRVLEQRLEELGAMIAVSSQMRPAPPSGNDAGDLLVDVDHRLAAVERLAAALGRQSGALDAVDRLAATAMLRELATACRDLRRVVNIAEAHLDEAQHALRRNQSEVEKFRKELAPDAPLPTTPQGEQQS